MYEHHVNYFVVAEDFTQAKKKAKELKEVINKKMHIDGMQEVESVCGFDICPIYNESREDTTVIHTYKPNWKE
jgi:hypothetical protein